MSGDLSLIYGGMFEERVGEDLGLPRSVLTELADDVRAGHAALAEKRESGALGFFDAPSERSALAQILEAAGEFRDRFDNLLVLGIGGSALGATAVIRALTPSFGPADGALRVLCLDNVDPAWVGEALTAFPLDRTGFAVISKSGTTPEPMSQYLVVRSMLQAAYGDDWAQRMVFITDAEKGSLRAEADALGARSFVIPPNVGGRFSVFTPVGLFPAACAGVDVTALLDGAARAQAASESPELLENRAYLLGALLTEADRLLGCSNHVLMPYSQKLWETAFWFRQLWAESLGKSADVGPTPIAALGATDQHSQMQLYMEGPHDKVIVFLEVEDPREDVPVPEGAPEALRYLEGSSLGKLLAAELTGSRAALLEAGRPIMTLRLPRLDAERMGALLQTFMVATALSGELYGIDAFNQPGVEAGKINAAALLGKPGLEEQAAGLRRTAAEIETDRV